MNKRNFITNVFLSITLLTLTAPIPVMAGSPINSINLTSHVQLEEGDDLKDLDWSEDGHDGDITKSGGKCWITNLDWKSPPKNGDTWNMGDIPEITVTLEAEGDYYFLDRYNSSKVTVKNGEFVSAKRKSSQKLEIVIKVKPVKGEAESPDEAYWSADKLGTGIWSKIKNVSTYEVKLYRGTNLVHKYDKIGGNKHNFFPYMTEPGTYSFSVRPVPSSDEQRLYMKVKDWTQSDDLPIEFDQISDGRGQEKVVTADDYGVGGWIQEGGKWHFRYPNGTYITNSWYQDPITSAWYLFNEESQMLTGWQVREEGMYYLMPPSGEMVTGWWADKTTKNQYYMNPTGTLYLGWLDYNSERYFMANSGAMSKGWIQIDGKWYYFDPNTGIMYHDTYVGQFLVDSTGAWVGSGNPF